MMKEEIINFKNQGKTIIFSSHRMEHIETLCDRLTILRKGRTVLQGRQLKEIKQSYNARTILIQGKLDADYLKSIPHVVEVTRQQDDWCVRIDHKQHTSTIFNALKPKIPIEKFLVCEPSLHEIFIEKVDKPMKSSKFWNYVLYNYLRKIKSKAFIGFNIFLIIVGLLISQLGSIVKFFNETFDYSKQFILWMKQINSIHNFKKILIIYYLK